MFIAKKLKTNKKWKLVNQKLNLIKFKADRASDYEKLLMTSKRENEEF